MLFNFFLCDSLLQYLTGKTPASKQYFERRAIKQAINSVIVSIYPIISLQIKFVIPDRSKNQVQ